jgi:tocopherol cyclase
MKKFGYQDKKSKNYFEGWYFRFTNDVNYAIIFAITKNEEDPHAFIQLFNETMDECIYERFDSSAFSFSNNVVTLGKNKLSLDHVYLNLKGTVLDIQFTNEHLVEKSAMGYLSNAPLDCFQEVILLSGIGIGTINGKKVTGTVYIEKTYGNKFPKKWIWLQSNYSKNKSMISFSVGYIPFLSFTVKGWLLIVKYHQQVLNFHSLAGASLKYIENGFIVKSRQYKIIVHYEKGKTITLVGPGLKAKMEIPVYESLTAKATIQIYKTGALIFEDEYHNVGLENMM